ncbi:MAG: hypothetical protein QF655_01305 [Candidatus Woesearchaeota archaeon]|jgi:hypothetical protein|nr:hypothetical protein [Candidatus Woesearchaeota archaeon]MDP6265791.1 hypothetical protein [Candidatus Woesearchaeota archaeon]MDP7322913.1 hypothetical protein [Candidatus Woesearchaeota archaeon]MDP7476253.1 hypothetical protein [Candidatus Woesearchaeota archaeon]HJO01884.1 hypothetical protein [Candidatus Woesearchaeota archaeon]|tara:strand:+ start:310 stop:795 length:486 start_codon:yes stop_codon:yes gene_type:complete
MVSTNYEIDREEILKNLIKYSTSLFERKDEEEQELSDLVDKNKINGNNHENLAYVDNYQQEREGIIYSSAISTYLDRRLESMHDFTDRVPGKNLETFPVSGNEGLYGYTFLGDIKAWRRDDLSGNFAKMVDIHESIHTPDEYETRILTDWIMTMPLIKYKK